MNDKEQASETGKGKPIPNGVMVALFFVGIFLLFPVFTIYRNTIIDRRILIGLWVLSGIIAQRVVNIPVKNGEKDSKVMRVVFQLFNGCFAFGGIVLWLFLASNYYLNSNAAADVVKTEIIEYGVMSRGKSGCEHPFATVEVYHIRKDLIFPCDTNLEKYSFVTLTLHKGMLGFQVITNRVLGVQ